MIEDLGWLHEALYDPPFQCCRGDTQRKWAWFRWHRRDERPPRTPSGRGCLEALNSSRKAWRKLALEIHLSLGDKSQILILKGVIVDAIERLSKDDGCKINHAVDNKGPKGHTKVDMGGGGGGKVIQAHSVFIKLLQLIYMSSRKHNLLNATSILDYD